MPSSYVPKAAAAAACAVNPMQVKMTTKTPVREVCGLAVSAAVVVVGVDIAHAMTASIWNSHSRDPDWRSKTSARSVFSLAMMLLRVVGVLLS
jgi:hypothetical protein